ncbi:MAG: protoporphyrinogen oxidase HemJ [Rickettsiaceae bacterium]|nr:protoporphyrinogen oxidase HemJ [Rickettsiaceae bacterium]
MEEYFLWYKVAHIIAVICWMAGLFYLPRLFVYHSNIEPGSETDLLFQTMERRLLRGIMNPAMVATYIFGILIAYIYGIEALGIWFHIKVLAVLALSAFHGFLAKCRKDFVNGINKNSANFFRIINEIPTILLIIIVIMVIVKPFE